MKAVLLARVSSAKQVDGFSLDAQIARLRDYCAFKGLEVIKEFVFEESSTRGDRKEFNAAIKFCKDQKETVALVADSVDRIQRSFKEWQMLETMRIKKTLELHFVRENMIISDNTQPFMLTMWEFMITIASGHVKNLAANVKRGMNQKLSEGEWGALAPIGYLNFRENNARRATILVDEVNAAIVKRLFEYYATQKYNLAELTRFAEDWGLHNPRTGKPLSKQSIIGILSNPFYYGEMRWNGQLLPHVYPPLVSKELWDVCDQFRRGIKMTKFVYAKLPFLYRGMLLCANTGKTISTQRHRGHNYLAYWDESRKLQYVREEQITEQIAKILDSFKLPAHKLKSLSEILKKSKNAEKNFNDSEVRRLQADLTKVNDKRKMLVDAFLEQKIDKDMYDETLAELNNQRKELTAKIDAYQQTDDDFNEQIISLYVAAQGYGTEWRWFADKLEDSAGNGDYDAICSKINSGRYFLKSIFRTLEIKDGKVGFLPHTLFDILQKFATCQEWSE